MLLATLAAFAFAPVVATALAVADLLMGRRRLPRVRVYAILLQYLFNDSIEILLTPLLWLVAGFGTRIHSRGSQRRHARLQRWSVDVLARRADRLLGLRLEVHGAEALRPAPAVVLSRHVSVTDASLPLVIYGRDTAYDVKGVIMAEMLVDPGFDLLYARPARCSSTAIAPRARNARSDHSASNSTGDRWGSSVRKAGPSDPTRCSARMQRLDDTDPVRAERLRPLRHVLPPRPGGVLSMLEGAPSADVVFIDHVGFESVPSIGELCRSAPLDDAIQVSVRRVPRGELPEDRDGLVKWLDEEWLRLDRWVHDTLSDSDPR